MFKAREMYAIDNPLANFDNYLICTNQGIQYRTANTNSSNEISVTQNNGNLQIEFDNAEENVNYRIFNSLGQLIHYWNSSSKQQNQDASNILQSSGIYILQAQTKRGNQSSKKFIYTK